MSDKLLGGRYAVQDKIGTGGMAVVYRGIDQVLGRTVAIKTMLPQFAADPSFAARFKQEAQAAAALQSPYIVSVYDWGKDGETYYIVMEYLRGTDLKSGIRRHGALDCKKVAQIGSQIAQALSVAHAHEIIHRDIKPQNIMVQPDGNVKVMDFGIARAKNSHLTTDNSVLGTAHYVSPEQTQGKVLGPTTDIYSLGVVMYEAATGSVPFDGDDAISVALKQVNEQPMPPSQRNPQIDPSLESIILKCMQKSPSDRFQSADELARVLRDYLAGRLRAVNSATATIQNVTTPLPVTSPTQAAAPAGNTASFRRVDATGHLRPQMATQRALQDEADRRRSHRRRLVAGTIVATILLVGAIVAVVSMLGNGSQTQPVPNFIGLTQEQALREISEAGYFQKGSVKEEYSSTVQKGLVIDQDPDAGLRKPKGTQINLVVSKGEEPAATVTVPDLTHMTPSEAEAALKAVGLVGQAGDSVYSSDVEVGTVASQSPGKDASAKAGDTVTYQLSKGAENVDVPNVVGMSAQEATSALEAAGFSVSTKSAESDEVDKGHVIRQSSTDKAAKGSTITITVSSGSTKATVPSVVGMSEGAAVSALKAAGFTASTSYEASSTVDKGTVISQSVTGSATRGSTIAISVSSGASANAGGAGSAGSGGN
ncbi:Stk1 family PASTA domain-containing Ser/Thr kinase [Olsenella massiliensis]|uniref:Stk1 family PASTA domain-containing Ser/Thr kinase n=1 Tax=Olsenella massiliensis TaxID=1622075 RepID=UPI00071E60CD|nr:Stk1 family PASTA domain-containing Ser/Thr kinase [Olsenella massiliensis]